MTYKYPLLRAAGRPITVREPLYDAIGAPVRDGHGKPRYRLHALARGLIEGTPDFVIAYQAVCRKIAASGGAAPGELSDEAKTAQKIDQAHKRDSLDWLIKRYLTKKVRRSLGPSTVYRIERSLQALRDALTDAGRPRGICRYADLTASHIEDLQHEWAQGKRGKGAPRQAELMVAHISAMFSWAMIRREKDPSLPADAPAQPLALYNPCLGVERLPQLSAGKKKKGTHAITEEEVAIWRRTFPDLASEPRLMLELGYLGGLRRSDIARIGPDDVTPRLGDDWHLSWTEHKYKERAPKERRQLLFTELRQCLIAAEKARPGAAFYCDINRKADEAERNPDYLENLMAKAFLKYREQAGLPARVTLHSFRAGGSVRLSRRLGWTPDAIAGWGGWNSIKHVIKYTEDLDRQAFADEQIKAANRAAGRQPKLRVVR